MQWIELILAGVLEITWATTMKMSDGFSKLIPSIITIAGYIASAIFLSMALKKFLSERHMRSGRASAFSAPVFWGFCFSKRC
jgi:hypothetical protein